MSNSLNIQELDQVYELALKLASEGGKLLKEGFEGNDIKMESKSDESDLVTYYDKLIEKTVKQMITETFQNHRFVGEETDAAGVKWELTNEPTWVIDPIDGTTNFVHNFPYVCISIAFMLNQEPVIGVVYNPILDELYTSRLNQGSYLNGVRLPIQNPLKRPISKISDCLLLIEFGGQRDQINVQSKTDSMLRLYKNSASNGGHCRGMRALGTAALNLCQLARGNGDFYWEFGPHVWDFAAAALILKEAGGLVTTLSGAYPNKLDLTWDNIKKMKLDLLNRKIVAVRAIDLNDAQKPESEKWEESKSKQWNIMKEALELIEDIEFPRDGSLLN